VHKATDAMRRKEALTFDNFSSGLTIATSPSKFDELFRIALIAETILSDLTVAEIIALQRVCR
jgi:hypothetical protein